MSDFNSFFKPIRCATPQDRISLINGNFWNKFEDFQTSDTFHLYLISLITYYPPALIDIVNKHPLWLNKIPDWFANDLAVCLRSLRGYKNEVETLSAHFKERHKTTHTVYAISVFERYLEEHQNMAPKHDANTTASCSPARA